MKNILHITSGDSSGDLIVRSGVAGDVFVWHDILYDGPRTPGWPTDEILQSRALFLEEATGGGLKQEYVLRNLRQQYARLLSAQEHEHIVLWFDACLFDQSMLVHLLACLHSHNTPSVELLCIDSFPGIDPYNGLGQLTPEQLAACYDRRRPVTEAQFRYAALADAAFATQDLPEFAELAQQSNAPLPWVPAAAARWLQEQPDPVTGLGRLEQLALSAVLAGCETPASIFASAAAADSTPQFWGDTTLWAKINALADRDPPLVRIEGPALRLPQWTGPHPVSLFRVYPVGDRGEFGGVLT